MKKIVKQIVGIDVAQKELVVSFGRMYEDWTPEVSAAKSFVNQPQGFAALINWVKKQAAAAADLRYVMEATGIYHERLAYYLADQGCSITIVLPNKISNYFKTLEVKTITDQTASQAIARFGLERKLDNWKRPAPVFNRLRQLSRERGQVVEQRTRAKNQLHAQSQEARPNKATTARLSQLISFLDEQEKEIKMEIAALMRQEKEQCGAIANLMSLSGVGELTAATVLGETNGFELIRNKRQLASYAGYDIKEKQSGTSVRGKPRISKRGNKHLRKAMHLPALTAIRHDERFKGIFTRLVAKHGVKMKAVVAVQRKLLEMIYTLYRTNQPYDSNYLKKGEVAVVAGNN